MKEPEIKLFGMMILTPEGGGDKLTDNGNIDMSRGGGSADDVSRSLEVGVEEKFQIEEDQPCGNGETVTPAMSRNPSMEGEPHDSIDLAVADGHPKSYLTEAAAVPESHPTMDNDQDDTTNNQKQILKKPDKILPCPRCNSVDTKFCYYNDFNVNQHRHICKSCQRYWTAGGAMRNVPVVTGRRKNKNPASRCNYLTTSDAFQAARIDTSNWFHHPMLTTNDSVLSFGPDSPFCESSMSSSFAPLNQRLAHGVRNEAFSSSENGENFCDPSGESSPVSISNSGKDENQKSNQQPVIQNLNVIPSPIPYIPGAVWPFPCHAAIPIPAMFPAGFSAPFYPAPYWSCNVPVPWNIPLWSIPPSTPNQKEYSTSGQSSPLGKHSRNGELLDPNHPMGNDPPESKNSDNSIIIPKTLRIDDPEEAAKSSIWSTLGIKYDSGSRKGLFSALQPKGDEKESLSIASPVLHSNPAALCRSINFQETA